MRIGDTMRLVKAEEEGKRMCRESWKLKIEPALIAASCVLDTASVHFVHFPTFPFSFYEPFNLLLLPNGGSVLDGLGRCRQNQSVELRDIN